MNLFRIYVDGALFYHPQMSKLAITQAQDQDEYNAKYDAAVSQYEATKAERDKLAVEIRQRGIRKREFDRFMRPCGTEVCV